MEALKDNINSFINTLNDLISKISIHLNESVLNQHNAVQIDISEALPIPSSNALLFLTSETVQSGFERLINSHILFDGFSTSEDNNSHYARQIYFDNSQVSDTLSSSNVQESIEDLANISGAALKLHGLNTTTNGLVRSGQTSDLKNNEPGIILVNTTPVSYSSPTTKIL